MKQELFAGFHRFFKGSKILYPLILLMPVMLIYCGDASCEQERLDQNTPSFLKAREAVDAVIEPYFFNNRIEFEEKISEDFPDRMDFLFEVEIGRVQNMPVDFEFFIDTVNDAKEVLSVLVSWNKKYVNWDDPEESISRGDSEFIFQKTSDGLLLKQIIGDNPF